jgi:hypothetical protein
LPDSLPLRALPRPAIRPERQRSPAVAGYEVHASAVKGRTWVFRVEGGLECQRSRGFGITGSWTSVRSPRGIGPDVGRSFGACRIASSTPRAASGEVNVVTATDTNGGLASPSSAGCTKTVRLTPLRASLENGSSVFSSPQIPHLSKSTPALYPPKTSRGRPRVGPGGAPARRGRDQLQPAPGHPAPSSYARRAWQPRSARAAPGRDRVPRASPDLRPGCGRWRIGVALDRDSGYEAITAERGSDHVGAWSTAAQVS